MSFPAGTPRPVLAVGDIRLRVAARSVDDPQSSDVRAAAADLQATLAAFRQRYGFGRAIAAPQIGVPLRMIALDLGEGPLVAFNPEVTSRSESTFTLWDDCMSFPWLLVRVRRHETISVDFLDASSEPRRWPDLPRDRSELLQHEIDHLDGTLALDRAAGPDPFVARELYEADPAAFRARVDHLIGD